jgi:glucose uptake protein GlcU
VEELVSKGKHHNWRRVAVFVAIGAIVLVLIIVGIVFLAGGSANDKRGEAIINGRPLYKRSSIFLENVVRRKFSPKRLNGTWISGEVLAINMIQVNMLHSHRVNDKGNKSTISWIVG